MQILIVGCGYLGRRVAARALAAGDRVTALTRSCARADELARQGIEPTVGEILEPASLAALPEADVLVYAVGYDRTSGVARRTVAVDGLQNVLRTVAGRVGRVVFVSSSSVYGQDAGEWVDETSPTAPQTEGGVVCLEAEEVLRRECAAVRVPACILRMSGLYGPGRLLSRRETLRQQALLAGSPEAWLNLIQIDDAAAAVLAAANAPQVESLYLVSDDRPVRRGGFYERLAELWGCPPPQFDPGQTPRHGVGLNKRCSNRRLRESLGLNLQYPTIESGLPAAVAADGP